MKMYDSITQSCSSYKKLFTVLLFGSVVGLLAGCDSIPLDDPNWYGDGSKSPTGKSDGKTSSGTDTKLPPAPFALGEVVARNDSYYREFWGMTEEGYFIVQDYYEKTASPSSDAIVSVDVTAAKLNDPYILRNQADVQTWLLTAGKVQQQYQSLGSMSVEGPYVQWYANGNKAIQGQYQDGLQQGTWTLWYENGNKMLEEEFKNGERQGESKGWYANGKTGGQGMYQNGQRHGVWKVWYENGAKLQEGSYDRGIQTGMWKFYYDNGVAKEAGNFENGEQVGVWTWWDRSGNVAREGEYSDNAMASPSGSGRIRPRYSAN